MPSPSPPSNTFTLPTGQSSPLSQSLRQFSNPNLAGMDGSAAPVDLPLDDSTDGTQRPHKEEASGTFASSVFVRYESLTSHSPPRPFSPRLNGRPQTPQVVFNSAVGTGILTLPYAFMAAGQIGGLLVLAFFMVVEFGTMRAIIECTALSSQKAYPGVVRHFLGPQWGSRFSAVIAIYCFFAATAAFIIVKNVTAGELNLCCYLS